MRAEMTEQHRLPLFPGVLAVCSCSFLILVAASAGEEVSYPEYVPTNEAIFERVEEICSWGIRRPGYPADIRTEQYIVDAFRSFNLKNVRKEPVEFQKWAPIEYSLVAVTDTQQIEIRCFPLPHTALHTDLDLQLALFDENNAAAVQGKASLHVMELLKLPATLPAIGGRALEALNRAARSPVRPEGMVVDPGGSLTGAWQTLPFTREIHEVMKPSQDAGAKAFIGVLGGHPGDICEYYVPYDGRERPFPGVWISESSGQKLQELMNQGVVRVRIVVEATRVPAVGHNIVGELPGADDDVLLIGSHHDGPWASAVEDAAGVALVLAQAEYWSQVPADERPHQMQFLLQAGHMVGSPGGRAFIRTHREMLDRIVLEMHLEHPAREIQKGENGAVLTGQPEPRWFFTSLNPDLQEAVRNALLSENLDRSLILGPEVFGAAPSTDGGMYHLYGVPLVNLLAAPLYLFDPLDTPDKVDQENLSNLTRAMIRVLESTRGVSALQMREGITKP